MRFVLPSLLAAASLAQPLRQPPKVYQVRLRAVGAAVSPLVPQRLSEKLRAELGRSPDIALMPDLGLDAGAAAQGAAGSAQAAAARPSGESAERLAEARALYAKAVELVKKEQFAPAAAALTSSVEGYEAGISELGRFEDFLEAQALLGVAQILAGQEEAGDEAFQRVITLSTTFAPKLDGHPPNVTAIWKSARGRMLKRKTGAVAITTQPAGAEVIVDGRKAGEAPAKADNLLPGSHYVVLRAAGMKTHVEKMDVAAGATSSMQLALDPAQPTSEGAATAAAAPAATPGGAGDVLRSAYYSEIGKRLGEGLVDMRMKSVAKGFSGSAQAEYLVLGHVGRDPKGYGLRAYLYRKDGNLLAELNSVQFDGELLNLEVGVAKLAEEILAAISEFPQARDITTVVIDEPDEKSGGAAAAPGAVIIDSTDKEGLEKIDPTPPVWRRWWFWAAVGGVVAAGTGVTIYLLATQEAPQTVEPTFTWP
ncbi:MAG: PEGA domain-containing protein [Myxococcota bacterium]